MPESRSLWWLRLLPVPRYCLPLLGGACGLYLIFFDSRAAKPSGTFPRQTSQPLTCFFLGQLPLLVPTKNLTHTCHGILHPPFSVCQNHTQKGTPKKAAELCGYIYEEFLLSDFLLSEAAGSSPPCMAQYTWLGSKPVTITPLPVSTQSRSTAGTAAMVLGVQRQEARV